MDASSANDAGNLLDNHFTAAARPDHKCSKNPVSASTNYGTSGGLLDEIASACAARPRKRAKRGPVFYGFMKKDLDNYFGGKPPPCEFNVVIDNQTLEVIATPDY